MKAIPLNDRVIIKRDTEESTTPSGIVIPNQTEKPAQGIVLAVGKNKGEPLEVKVDDRVLFGKYSGTTIKVDGEDYLIMPESDIYAIIVESSHG
jgi:chaperonin GroES